MRSTRASAAVERLKERSGNNQYSVVRTSAGLFFLVESNAPATPLCESMELDDFVNFVKAFGPQTPKRVSKLDLAFERQLKKKNP